MIKIDYKKKNLTVVKLAIAEKKNTTTPNIVCFSMRMSFFTEKSECCLVIALTWSEFKETLGRVGKGGEGRVASEKSWLCH